MIDKSIRQHYQNGEKVNPLLKMGEQLTSPKTLKTAGKEFLKHKAKGFVAEKLGIASVNPLLLLLGKVMPWMKAKWGKEGAFKAFQAGMTGTQADYEAAKELRVLEKRRDYMLRRRDEGKKFSQKNLDEVTAQINTIKKTSPITDYETEAYGAPDTIKDILDEQYEFEDKRTQQFRDSIITPPVWDPGIAAQEEAAANKAASDAMVAKEIAAAEAFRADKEKQEELARQAKAYAEAQAAKPPPQITQPTGGGNGGGQPQTGGGGYERGDYGGRGYHWAKGGRVDKALGGRSRDI